MNKIFFAVITLMTAFVVSSCGKDETADTTPSDSTRTETVEHRVEQVFYEYTEITHEYENTQLQTLVNADTSTQAYVSERWQWDGDTLRSIAYYNEEGLRYTVSFGYANGKRVRYQRSDEEGLYTRFIYSGDRLDSIVSQNGGQRTWQCAFVFASDREFYPGKAVVTSFSNGMVSSTTEYNLTFQDGNLRAYSYQTNGASIRKQYTYDDSANPYLRAGRSLSYLYLSRNNAVAEDYHYEGDGRVSDEHTDYVYTYNENAIATLYWQTQSVVGRYVNTYTRRYTYTYLQD